MTRSYAHDLSKFVFLIMQRLKQHVKYFNDTFLQMELLWFKVSI